jgi:hypothetical protein
MTYEEAQDMHMLNQINPGYTCTCDEELKIVCQQCLEADRNLPVDINGRITEIKKEIAEIEALKKANRISANAFENVPGIHKIHQEWNRKLSELRKQLAYLEQIQR